MPACGECPRTQSLRVRAVRRAVVFAAARTHNLSQATDAIATIGLSACFVAAGFVAHQRQHGIICGAHRSSLLVETFVSMAEMAGPPALPAHAALYLDVDGTLISFAARPDEVRV